MYVKGTVLSRIPPWVGAYFRGTPPATPRALPPTLHLVGPLPLVVDLKPCFGARQCTFWSYSVAKVPQKDDSTTITETRLFLKNETWNCIF
jgi:hypothetical protein